MKVEGCFLKPQIHKANSYDIEELVKITKICFPESLKYNTAKWIAHKNWERFLKSKNFETYIALFDGKIVGFCVLSVDIEKQKIERKNLSIDEKFFQALAPILGCIKKPILIKKKFTNLIKFFFKKPYCNQIVYNQTNNNNLSVQKIAWIHIIATDLKFQKKGIASELNKHVITRCLQLKKDVIGSSVHEENTSSKMLFESLGYVVVNKNGRTLIYKKYLLA